MSKLGDSLARGYKHAKRAAMKETGIDQSNFPALCPWTFQQAMSPDFWPEPA